MIEHGDWEVFDMARNAFDLEGKALELDLSDTASFSVSFPLIARNSSTTTMHL